MYNEKPNVQKPEVSSRDYEQVLNIAKICH